MTIYHGNCREFLPMLEPESVDLVLIKGALWVEVSKRGKRSDFQNNVKSRKWLGYLEHCHLFFFFTHYRGAAYASVKREMMLSQQREATLQKFLEHFSSVGAVSTWVAPTITHYRCPHRSLTISDPAGRLAARD